MFHEDGGAESLAHQILPGGCRRLFRSGVSKRISLWGDDDSDPASLVVVMFSGEKKQSEIDFGLAYGLRFRGDADLHLLLPLGRAEPSLYRTTRLAPPITVWEVDGNHLSRLDAPTRHVVESSTRLDTNVRLGRRDLGDIEWWLEPLQTWAEGPAGLDPAHRQSYLSWHYAGRQLLKVTGDRTTLTVTAGIDYAAHRTGVPMAAVVVLTGPLEPDDLRQIQAAVLEGKRRRDDGTDGENREHALQSSLQTGAGIAALGLVGSVLREVPANRPGSRRAYIDLLGVDHDGAIHVIETKIGVDAMLGLQGLDYWVWALANRDLLVDYLRSEGHDLVDRPEIVVDVVVGSKKDDGVRPDLRYLAPQARAFASEVRWRLGHVTGWASAAPSVQWWPANSLPDANDGSVQT